MRPAGAGRARSAGDDAGGLPAAGPAGDHGERAPLADVDAARAVGDGRAVEPPLAPVDAADGAVARGVVEGDDVAALRHDLGEHGRGCLAQWTILAIGISSRSVAPASLSAGISTLICALGTTASTA